MPLVNGYYCRNCADVELARRGLDPARPPHEMSGSEVYVPPTPEDVEKRRERLGLNEPVESGDVGRHVNLRA